MKNKTSLSTLRWMSRTAGRAKVYIAGLLAVNILLGICTVGYAMLLREIVNAAAAGMRGSFFGGLAKFILLVILQIVLQALNRHLEERSKSTLENRFKQNLFSNLLNGDYASVTQIHSGEWMNRLTSDTVHAAEGMTQILPGVAGMGVKLVGAIAAILWLEPRFLFILLPGGILILVSATVFRKAMKSLHRNIREADGKLRVFMTERLGSMLVIRSFAQEKATAEQSQALMEEHGKARMKRMRFSNLCNIGFSAGMNGLYVLGVGFCGYGILTGTMSYGNLLAVLQLVSQIQSPFANITAYLPRYYSMLASAERLMEAENFKKDAAGSECPEFSEIGLRNVSFTYQPPVQHENEEQDMPVVLKDLNFSLSKGEYAALTGPSGCGKSTVLKLLMSLYEPDSGECYYISAGEEKRLTSSERGLFAYVPQGNQLLSGTVRELISFGDREKMQQEDKLLRALDIACAKEFVQELDNGLDTMLGERGAGLSEGQMQRIAIARAIFSDRPVILLDEATSALDEETEAGLLEKLKNMTDKTVVIVTHRPAALAICTKHISLGENVDDAV